MIGLLLEFLLIIGVIVGGAIFIFKVVKNMIGRKLNKDFTEKYIDTPGGGERDKRVEKKLANLDKTDRTLSILSFIMMPAIAIPFILLIFLGSIGGAVFIPMLLICGLITVGGLILRKFTYKTTGRTKQLLSLYVQPVLEEFFGSDVTYETWGNLSHEVVASSCFFDRFDKVSGADLVRGRYRGCPLMFSDVIVKQEQEYEDPETGKKKTKLVDIFNGYWVVVDFDRELTPYPLNVHEERTKRGIQMEDEAFNKKFSVFCGDEHTAFYILTPHFMQRLVSVDQIAAGKTKFRFDKNRLQIAVDGGVNLFSPGNLDKAKVPEIQESFRNNLRQITGLIDEMMKHERLFGDPASEGSDT